MSGDLIEGRGMKIMKWIPIPVLLFASLFACCAARYEPLVDFGICLGAIIFEMLTGQVPFQGPNVYAVMNSRLVGDPPGPRTLNPEIPPQVEEIVLHAMERDPFKRYHTAAAMRAELAAPETVHVTGRHQRLRRASPWKRKFRNLRMYVIIGLAPIVLFLLLWLMLSRQAHH